jgi:FemAB-related protein (PEP-CTERM system-associated)
MQCLECRDFDPRWDEFIQASSEGTFFHLLKWRNLIARNFGYEPFYLYVEREGQILGVLPLFLARSLLFGRSLISIPVGIYGGVVSRNEKTAMLLLRKAQELAHEYRAGHLEIRGNPYRESEAFCDDLNNEFRFKRKDHHVTFIREIDAKDEANFARIPRKQRRMIRQAQKNGLQSFMDDGRLWDCFQVYAESLRNLGTPVYSYKYFQDLKKTFGDQCRILLVEYQRKIVAGVLSFIYKDQVLPYYGGSLPGYRHLAANDFMYWELLAFGAANGYRIFDFGRSKKDSGSFNFKRHWGFEPLSLPSFYYQVNGNEISDIRSLNSKLEWAIKVWRRLPLRLTMALGPRIAPHLPW